MRTRDFIRKYCKYCQDFEPGLGCGVQWADEVCSNAIYEDDYHYHGKDMVDRIAEYFDKIEEKKHPRKQIETKKYPTKLTEAQLGNHIHFPQPEFAYIIYVHDEEDDIKNIWIDSVWTNDADALNRMKILEQMENAILDMDTSKKYSYRYKLHGYSEKFPYPEGLSIYREKPDGTVHDYKYSIHCERGFFNKKDFLKPFNPNEYRVLDKKAKGKNK